ncbi:MAG: roadblock/LC7 domain-containing protein [Planctomycetota bacterium]|jgi:predicted regulator of Ras-like GTPase activity (Roadblock/LC7/MglB family)
MKELLKGLNESIGIRGSLVITKDGVIVQSLMADDLEEETIGALASSVLNALMDPGSSRWLGDVTRFTMTAKHGRLVFEIVESLVLVVVIEKDIDLDITLLEISGLAKRLQRMVKISV